MRNCYSMNSYDTPGFFVGKKMFWGFKCYSNFNQKYLMHSTYIYESLNSMTLRGAIPNMKVKVKIL